MEVAIGQIARYEIKMQKLMIGDVLQTIAKKEASKNNRENYETRQRKSGKW